MAWIYKISNIINNKIYIGYTKYTPQHRYQEHWCQRFQDKSLLHKAMIKYGKNCFICEGIEEISEELGFEREIYYIDFFNSKNPNGYNLTNGGENPPIHFGSDNVKSKLTENQFLNLVKDLQHYDLNFSQIALKYKLSQSQIERINKGEFRYQESISYPIRKLKKDQYIIQNIIQDLKENILSQEEIEEKYHIKSRTRLYDINNGKVGNKLFNQEQYPIRPNIKNQKPKYLS